MEELVIPTEVNKLVVELVPNVVPFTIASDCCQNKYNQKAAKIKATLETMMVTHTKTPAVN